MAIVLTKDNFDSEVLKATQTVLVDFYADWCGPCKMMAPIIEKLAQDRTDAKICKINIDDEAKLAEKYGVMSIPTIVAFKNGQEAGRSVGLVSQDKLEDLI